MTPYGGSSDEYSGRSSKRLATDGGTSRTSGQFEVVVERISDGRATAYTAMAVRIDPGDHPLLKQAGFHSPQTLFVLFGSDRPVADYDPYKIPYQLPGDADWVVDELQRLDDALRGEIATDGGRPVGASAEYRQQCAGCGGTASRAASYCPWCGDRLRGDGS